MKTKILTLFLALSAGAFAAENIYAKLQPGSMAEPWLNGGPNCLTIPTWQVHEYNEDFYILRESGCVNPEKPFLYLIFGENKALLEDTGVATLMPDGSRGTVIPTAPIIMDLMAKWAARKKHAPVSLVVIHSHSHSDHTAADGQFKGLPGVQFIAAAPDEIQKAAGIKTWPSDIGQIDLGNRIIDVIPIPGHDVASIALYDRITGNLTTGDSLYPGRLYARDLPGYAASAKRLVEFVKAYPVAHVLGAHIEEGAQPYFDYPQNTVYFPHEHVLELSRAQVFELDEAFRKMDGKPVKVVYPDFSVIPVGASPSVPVGIQGAAGEGLEPGVVPTGWRSGGPNCMTVPDWQVKEYNEDFYVLRESGCVDPEKPFLYPIFGENEALLEDTGVAMLMPDGKRGTVIATAPVITDLLAKWAAKKKHAPVSLILIHSHSHSDHTAGDEQFKAQPDVQYIAPTPAEIQKAVGIANWPTGVGQIDLGGRVIDVIPIPGHDVASIALYDRRTGNLLTGDSLYPGRLGVDQANLATFAASAQRLTDFVGDHPVAHVLGTHIEQKAEPYVDYVRGTSYQPEEHVLELSRAHILELNDAFISLHGKLQTVAMPDTTIAPRGGATASPTTSAASSSK